MNKLRVNMVSESDISVQGHGVHTAYDELATALEQRRDIALIRGKFDQQIDCDIVHMHTIGNRTWKKITQKNVKKVVSAHIVPASFVGSLVLARYWQFAARWYMRWYYGKADKVLAVSGTVARILVTDLGIHPNKIETFYNTINMANYAPKNGEKLAARTRLGFAKDAFIVLGNGQVQQRKRVDIFVAMARQQPDVTFVWIGGIPFKRLGADYEKMNHLIKSVPNNLKMTGIIEHSAVRDYLLAADVFCLPAEQENHPMCVLEAAGAQLPIVLRDIPEYDDTFMNDAWRCSDPTFNDAIKKLKDSPTAYREWQKKSNKIRDRFDSKAGAERLIKIYSALVS